MTALASPSPRRRKKPARRRRFVGVAIRLAAVAVVIAAGVSVVLWVEVTRTFESRLWADPSEILSAPWVLEVGASADAADVEARLRRSGYALVVGGATEPGTFRRIPGGIDVHLRATDIPGQALAARRRLLRFRDGVLVEAIDPERRRHREVVLEPEVLATLYGPRREDRRPLRFSEFPEGFVRAVLAAEDARYFEHRGVDPRAIVRAALANLRSGRVVQGGSTISQQTVKNLSLGHQRTLWRKLRELPMAVIVDLRYSKERILEVYLNEVYLGQRGSVAVCGAESASRYYFGRSIEDLDDAGWALLAGMIRSPGRYNPFAHPEAAVARRGQVLEAMVRLGWMDPARAQRAEAEPLRLASGESGYTRARYLADAVRADLARIVPAGSLDRAGLRVHTTLDTRTQEVAETALRAGLERLESTRPALRRGAGAPRLQGAVVVTEPSSGAVRALVGGRDYAETQFNRAIDAHRQPGSCFKPFVYLAAFAATDVDGGRVTAATTIDDAPLTVDMSGTSWTPSNYDGRFRGPVTAHRALRDSLNVPAVRLARYIGLDRVVETARACGIESPLEPYPSLALGAREVTPLELAGAYGTLANGGIRVRPRLIEEIRDRDGRRIERRDPAYRRVVDARPTFVLNQVLTDVLDGGTARSARALGWDGRSAGKTGTTDDDRDAWFVGYTPKILALVWVGFDDNARTGLTGASGALPIWVDIMRDVAPEVARAEFRRVPGVVRAEVDPFTGLRAAGGCPEVEEDWFEDGTAPRETCEVHGGRRRHWFRDLFRRRAEPRAPI